MKPLAMAVVRWIQPVMVAPAPAPAELVTRAVNGLTLTAGEIGVSVVVGRRRVLVPWSNVRQADE